MRRVSIIYHYYPRFRQPIFEALTRLSSTFHFVYGRNARFGVANLQDDNHDVRRNVFLGTVVLQSFGLSTLWSICRGDSIILGDSKFLNSWLYAIIGRLCGRQVWFWTHGVLEPERGLKWWVRRAYYKLAHGLMLYSANEARLLRELGYDKPLFVVGNANYTENDVASLNPVPLGNRQDGLCYVGRISENKGLSDFIRFAQAHPGIRVVLVGPIADGCKLPSALPRNLLICAPEYTTERLKVVTESCGTLVMFSPAGLSLFTGILLGKRLLIRDLSPQKPEFHLLNQYGLVQTFDDYDDLVRQMREPVLSDKVFQEARERFLRDNAAEQVAARIVAALQESCEPCR